MWTANPEDSEVLATRIRNYWAVRGYKIQTQILGLAELGETSQSGSHFYSVRSNMLGGWPPSDPAAPINVIASPSGTLRTRVASHPQARA